MKGLIDEYGKVLIYIGIAIVVFLGAFGIIQGSFKDNTSSQLESYNTEKGDTNEVYLGKDLPVIAVNENVKINVSENFDVISTPAAKITDEKNKDISSRLEVYGTLGNVKFAADDWKNKRNVKITQSGLFLLKYVVRDENGLYASQYIQVAVEPNPQ